MSSALIDLQKDVRANLSVADNHLARIDEFVSCTYTRALDHSGACVLEVSPDASYLAAARQGRVLRITDERQQPIEYRIQHVAQALDKPTVTITAEHVIHDLNRYFLWESLGGIPTFVQGATDLLATEFIDNFALPTLLAAGVTYATRGTVQSTRRINLDWTGQTVLWLLNQLIVGTDLDIQYRITNPGSAVERYAIDLMRVGEDVRQPIVIVGENAEALEWAVDGEPQANVVIPQGKIPAGGLEPSNIGEYVARVVSVDGNALALEDPDGNVAPVYATDQMTGLYLELLVPPINTGALG